MSNPSKQKGTAFETAQVRYLHDLGYGHVERRALAGSTDKGDVAGIRDTVLELKNCAKLNLAGWVREAELERRNAGASLGAVVHKRKGVTDPASQYVTLTFGQFVSLLADAGRL